MIRQDLAAADCSLLAGLVTYANDVTEGRSEKKHALFSRNGLESFAPGLLSLIHTGLDPFPKDSFISHELVAPGTTQEGDEPTPESGPQSSAALTELNGLRYHWKHNIWQNHGVAFFKASVWGVLHFLPLKMLTHKSED